LNKIDTVVLSNQQFGNYIEYENISRIKLKGDKGEN
jgi:hypothetical protein